MRSSETPSSEILEGYIEILDNGEIPKGCVVHHINHDALDDSPENLKAITRAEHLMHHRPEFEEKRSQAAVYARWGKR